MAARALEHSLDTDDSQHFHESYYTHDDDRATTPRTQFDVYLSHAKLTPLLTHDALIRLAREVYVHRYAIMQVFSEFLPCASALAEQYQYHETYGHKLSGFATGLADQSVESRDATLARNRTYGKGQDDGEVQDETLVRAHCDRLNSTLRQLFSSADHSEAGRLRAQVSEDYLKVVLRVDEFERHTALFETYTDTLRQFAQLVCEITGANEYPAELDRISLKLISRLAHLLPEERQAEFHDLGLEVHTIQRSTCLAFSEVLRLRERYDHHKAKRNELVNTIVQSNLLLAARETLKQKPSDDRLFDLCQEANFGLMIAADRFSYWRDLAFSTYAVFWIRQRLIRDRDHNANPAFSIPCSVANRVKKVLQTRTRLQEETGETVSSARIAAELGITRALVDEALQSHILPFDVTGDTVPLPMPEVEDVFGDASRASLRETLMKALKLVPERKRQIFDMRFGISSEETYTLCEVAARYGITKEAIRRVERDVINQLRTGPYGHALRDFHASH